MNKLIEISKDILMLNLTIKQWFKLWVISALAAIFRVTLQLFIPEGNAMPFEPSIISKAGLLPLAFTIYAIIAYGFLAMVFMMIQSRMPGNRVLKGLKFGLVFGVMWILYLIEPFPHMNGAKLTEYLSYPLADCVGLVFLGLLLGKFLAQDRPKEKERIINNYGTQVLIIAVCFVILRIYEYGVLKYYSSFYEKPFITVSWTLLTGLWVGFMYVYLSPLIGIKNKLLQIVFYSFIIFGLDLCFFNYFIALVFKVNNFQVFIKSLIDITSILMGGFISSIVLRKVIYEDSEYKL